MANRTFGSTAGVLGGGKIAGLEGGGNTNDKDKSSMLINVNPARDNSINRW